LLPGEKETLRPFFGSCVSRNRGTIGTHEKVIVEIEGTSINELKPSYPVVIIGAGPTGLAAAAHLVRKGETPLLFEAGKDEELWTRAHLLTADWL